MELEEDEEKIIEEQLNSFIPNCNKSKQDDIINRKLNLPYPTLSKKPVDEFSKD